MRRFLTYRDVTGRVLLTELGGGPPLLVGRDARCQIQYTDPTLSGEHCRISCDDTHSFVEDLGSTNGTYINEHRLLNQHRRELRADDVIRCGVLRLRMVLAIQADATTQSGVLPVPPQPVSDGEAAMTLGCTNATPPSLPAADHEKAISDIRLQLLQEQRGSSKLTEDLQRALRCIRLLDGVRERLENEGRALQKELQDARTQSQELQQSLETVQKDHRTGTAHWRQLLSAAQAATLRAEHERSQILAQTDQLRTECDGLKQVSISQEKQITNLKTELLSAKQRIENLLPTLERTEQQLSEARAHTLDALRKVTREVHLLQAEARTLRQENERLRLAAAYSR